MNTKKFLLLIAVAVLWLSLAARAAAAPPLPPTQRTPQAELWLARTFVGEAGWRGKRAHAGIAHVLARRWHRVVVRFPAMRFETVIKNYAHALGFKRMGTPTKRQLWIRGLLGELQPEHWPAGSRWSRHAPLWHAALERSRRWFAGRVKDPCRGRAWHWGGTIDVDLAARKRMQPIECGDTGGTTFYDTGETDE